MCNKELKSMHSVKVNTIPDATFCHLSFKPDLEGIWKPKPVDQFEQWQVKYPKPRNYYPEPRVPRISVGTGIHKCFLAVYPNISHFFEFDNLPYVDMHVYMPVFKGHEDVVTPDIATAYRYIYDAHVTEEHCILSPVLMKHVGTVRIKNPNRSDALLYYPFDDNTLDYTTIGPRKIDWEWVNKPMNMELFQNW